MSQALDSTVPLVALGLDSLNALHLRRRIKTEFSCEVAVSELLGGATLDDVVRMVTAGTRIGRAGRARRDERPDAGPSSGAVDFDMSRIPSARSDLDLFGLGAIWRVLEPVLGDGDIHTADEIAERLQFAERHRWVLRQWLHELTARGFLHHDAGGYRRARAVPSPTRSDLVAVCSDLGYLPPFGQFLDDANSHLADLVTDRVSVQELLFPNGSMTTADAFYRDNAISRYLNLGARTAVADAVRRLMVERSPVRILELGAGVGGMTDDIVAGLTGSACRLPLHRCLHVLPQCGAEAFRGASVDAIRHRRPQCGSAPSTAVRHRRRLQRRAQRARRRADAGRDP